MTEPDQRRLKPGRREVDEAREKGSRLLLLILLAVFATAIGTALALKATHDQVDDINAAAATSRATAAVSKKTADRSKATADRLAAVVKQIQVERERNTRNACEETNARHDRTVRRIRKLAAGGDPRRIQATIGLIDALAPHRDCDALVDRQVQGAKP